MKIMMVTNTFFPHGGGVVNAIKVTADALQHQGHDVVIVTFNLHDDDQACSRVIRLACWPRFNYKQNNIAVPWRITRSLHEIVRKQKPDIIHVHHPFLLGAAAVAIGKRYKIPTVFTHHTLYEFYTHYIPLPHIVTKFFIKTIIKKIGNSVNAIIAPSFSLSHQLKNKGITKPITVIPSSIAEEFFLPNFSYKESKELFNLVVVSRFVKEKNLYFLLDVMQVLRDKPFTLTLVGYGAEYGALNDYAYKKLKLSPQQVTFIIKPTKDVLVSWYRTADLFIFSSHSETQGLVLAEAMASATPVIALKGPAIADIVEHSRNGFIVSSKEEMAEYIENIFYDKNLWRFLQRNAWQTAQHYRAESIVKNLANYYRTIL